MEEIEPVGQLALAVRSAQKIRKRRQQLCLGGYEECRIIFLYLSIEIYFYSTLSYPPRHNCCLLLRNLCSLLTTQAGCPTGSISSMVRN